MNLKSIINSMLFVAFMFIAINAQSLTEATTALDSAIENTDGKTEMFVSIVIVDGKSMIAKNRHEFQVLCSMVDMVNVLKRVKAKKGISGEQYNDQVAALLNHAEALGIKIN